MVGGGEIEVLRVLAEFLLEVQLGLVVSGTVIAVGSHSKFSSLGIVPALALGWVYGCGRFGLAHSPRTKMVPFCLA